MTEKLKQIIKDEVAKLPKENQTVINAFGWEQITEEIGKKYLFESEMNDFQVETLLVLIGLENPEMYTINVENNIGTSRDGARQITDEVFKKIFIPISDTIEENIKKSEKVKNSKWDQNLDFVLSGGNYGAFAESPPLLNKEGNEGRFLENSPHPNPLLIKERGEKQE
jgi:hypothetical protein